MAQVIQYLLNGIMNGALYALIAVGIVSIFKSTKVVSFAHGHIIMFGAYFYFTFSVILPGAEFMPDWVAKWEPEWLLAYKEGAVMFSPKAAIAAWVSNLPRIIMGVVGSLVCNALLAVFIERAFMRPLIGKSSLSMILCTVGLIWVLEGSASLIWSADIDQVPPLGPNFPIRFTVFDSQVFLFSSSAINFVIALTLFIGLLLVLRYTRSGVAVRATAEDQSTAYAMGINVPAVFTTAWVVAATTGAIAGAILASRNGLSPTLGLFGLSVLAVVLMGGLDSYVGVFIASMVIGIFEAFTQWKFGGEYAEIVPYVLVLLVIIWRPNGLMGQAEIERI
jgi:branched-chain amino acid transport system permease protein